MSSPLNGIKVIDLSQYAPGPYATKILCDLGAEVIKIEPPSGDPMRGLFVSQNRPGQVSPVYQQLNAGKQIARINLKDPDCRDHFYKLLTETDVVLESFRPGVVSRLGVDYQKCQSIHPGLVYCSLSGYGQEGPLRNKAGHDINYCAAAGMYSFNLQTKPTFPLIADHSGAMNAVTAILANLVGRQGSWTGAYLDMSLYEAMVGWQYVANPFLQDIEASELQLLTGGGACYNFYTTQDERQITVGALEPTFWSNFCNALGQPQWLAKQFETMPQTKLIQKVQQIIGANSLSYWVNLFHDIDCCFQPVPLAEDIYHHQQTTFRGIASKTNHSFPGKIDGISPSTTFHTIALAPGEPPNWKQT